MEFNLKKQFDDHTHDGVNSKKMAIGPDDVGTGIPEELQDAPLTALTPANNDMINTGDTDTDAVVANMRGRIEEIETRLENLGLIE